MYLHLSFDFIHHSPYRGLLDDTQFHEACQKVVEAPTPYYDQFVDMPLPHSIPPTPSPIAGVPDIMVSIDDIPDNVQTPQRYAQFISTLTYYLYTCIIWCWSCYSRNTH